MSWVHRQSFSGPRRASTVLSTGAVAARWHGGISNPQLPASELWQQIGAVEKARRLPYASACLSFCKPAMHTAAAAMLCPGALHMCYSDFIECDLAVIQI